MKKVYIYLLCLFLILFLTSFYAPYFSYYSNGVLITHHPYSDFIVADSSDRLRMWLFQVSVCPVQWYFMVCGVAVIF